MIQGTAVVNFTKEEFKYIHDGLYFLADNQGLPCKALMYKKLFANMLQVGKRVFFTSWSVATQNRVKKEEKKEIKKERKKERKTESTHTHLAIAVIYCRFFEKKGDGQKKGKTNQKNTKKDKKRKTGNKHAQTHVPLQL